MRMLLQRRGKGGGKGAPGAPSSINSLTGICTMSTRKAAGLVRVVVAGDNGFWGFDFIASAARDPMQRNPTPAVRGARPVLTPPTGPPPAPRLTPHSSRTAHAQ